MALLVDNLTKRPVLHRMLPTPVDVTGAVNGKGLRRVGRSHRSNLTASNYTSRLSGKTGE